MSSQVYSHYIPPIPAASTLGASSCAVTAASSVTSSLTSDSIAAMSRSYPSTPIPSTSTLLPSPPLIVSSVASSSNPRPRLKRAHHNDLDSPLDSIDEHLELSNELDDYDDQQHDVDHQVYGAHAYENEALAFGAGAGANASHASMRPPPRKRKKRIVDEFALLSLENDSKSNPTSTTTTDAAVGVETDGWSSSLRSATAPTAQHPLYAQAPTTLVSPPLATLSLTISNDYADSHGTSPTSASLPALMPLPVPSSISALPVTPPLQQGDDHLFATTTSHALFPYGTPNLSSMTPTPSPTTPNHLQGLGFGLGGPSCVDPRSQFIDRPIPFTPAPSVSPQQPSIGLPSGEEELEDATMGTGPSSFDLDDHRIYVASLDSPPPSPTISPNSKSKEEDDSEGTNWTIPSSLLKPLPPPMPSEWFKSPRAEEAALVLYKPFKWTKEEERQEEWDAFRREQVAQEVEQGGIEEPEGEDQGMEID